MERTGAREARRRAAKHLEGLYGMVVAVGLGIAVSNAVQTSRDAVDVRWDHVPLIAALVVLVVPFYQGALLHLDDKYERDSRKRHPTVVLLVDFCGLFVEAVLIVVLASAVGD